MFFLFFSNCPVKVYDVTWSPNGDRLVAVTWGGNVIQVTNNTAHSTVFNNSRAVCNISALLFTHLMSSCMDARSAPAGSLLLVDLTIQ